MAGAAVTVIEYRGERIAALVHDAALLDEPGLVDGVASATAMAVSNVRLRADLRRQVAELEASRRRLLEARDAQRQGLQQELADGVARRLVRELHRRPKNARQDWQEGALLVVESGLQYDKVLAVNEVDQAVFLADPPGPGTSEHVAKRLRLPDPSGWVAQGVLDQPVDPLEHGPVGR